ncbi:MAG: YihA family ribosome biogenesis GTP-binding protein [Candidatus Magasanikbacteria bacterium]|nr:YihA family ribosome biogenesis GTP-binding protein [Candidatus Magasanikbacteria bacterium]MCA9389604.1 YihA family ribosome biogenesis GTP-binding protein [Candidatus Magasanikbacteria bacterium]MCA9391138.1 YihA family ribosome biogenesis GTP-binding protein [Candidatus Magasanikbacteria bacterium]USN52644.1 MAG: YihA family ribosome biogenesis GTP-binding protein [Candidatus Nomurabacteria bacterium]
MITFVKSGTTTEHLPKGNKPQIAFIGRSNVGKSSLINHLAGQKQLAHSSSTPGRTRTINVFDVDKRYFLIDLPGYGYAKGRKTAGYFFDDMIGGYLENNPLLKLVFVIIDARLGPTELDQQMLSFLQAEKIPFAIIANKVDKLTHSEKLKLRKELEASYAGLNVVMHSSTKTLGKGDVLDLIDKHL